LLHDGERKALPAGRVLVAIPFPYVGLLMPSGVIGLPGDCRKPNRAALTRMLASEAVRSPQLEKLAR